CRVEQVIQNAPYSYVGSGNDGSSIKSLNVKPQFSFRIFLEDIIGFTMNLFLWPIHSMIIMQNQILFILFFPIFLPFLMISAFFEALFSIFDICFCKCCCDKILSGPKFSSYEPSSAEIEALKPYISHAATEAISEDQQLRLLH